MNIKQTPNYKSQFFLTNNIKTSQINHLKQRGGAGINLSEISEQHHQPARKPGIHTVLIDQIHGNQDGAQRNEPFSDARVLREVDKGVSGGGGKAGSGVTEEWGEGLKGEGTGGGSEGGDTFIGAGEATDDLEGCLLEVGGRGGEEAEELFELGGRHWTTREKRGGWAEGFRC